MLLAQISDTHILSPDSDHPSAQLRADCLQQTVADVNRCAPDAILFTGDTTQHGDPVEYQRLLSLLAPLEAPVYPVPGNRDDKHQLRTAFGGVTANDDAEFLQYVVEDADVRLIAVDSTQAGDRKGVFCAARQQWLSARLAEAPDRPTVLFIHHPPFDVDDHYINGYRNNADAAALAEIIRTNTQVFALICGHVHWLIDRQWNGIEVRIMPSIAVDVRKGIDETDAQHRPIYWLHHIDANGSIWSEERRA